MSPRTRIAPLVSHLICALGLALALYLTLLKWFTLPCHAPGDCHKIIFSTYGSIFRLPVGLYAAVLWIAVIVQRDSIKRAAFLGLLSASALAFMFIQFVVLRGFCLYCTLHALCTWAAFALYRIERKPTLTLLLAVVFASGGFALSWKQAHALPSATNHTSTARLNTASGLPWLAPLGPQSPTLILSLDCPACLELLEQLTAHDFTSVKTGPVILFKTTPTNHILTRELLAATLAQKDLPIRDAMLATVAFLLRQKNIVLSKPEAAAQTLTSLFPNSASEYSLAERIIDSHTRAINEANLPITTPLLLTADGSSHTHIILSALFTQ